LQPLCLGREPKAKVTTIIWFHTPYVLCLFTMFYFVVWLLIDVHPFFSFSFSI
jgi:hypothetical protein